MVPMSTFAITAFLLAYPSQGLRNALIFAAIGAIIGIICDEINAELAPTAGSRGLLRSCLWQGQVKIHGRRMAYSWKEFYKD